MTTRPCLLVPCAPSGSRTHPPYVKSFRANCPAKSVGLLALPQKQGREQLQAKRHRCDVAVPIRVSSQFGFTGVYPFLETSNEMPDIRTVAYGLNGPNFVF